MIDNLKQILEDHCKWLFDESGKRADLRYANLEGANLSGANLRKADLSEADLRKADLSHANLREANLRWSNLRGANLRGANLRRASLRGANLRGASLRWSNLRGANLRRANLRGASLEGANLEWANLGHADLEWADLGHTICDPHITNRNRNHAKRLNQRGIIAYRTKVSRWVGNTVYEPGRTYTAPVMSWCPNTECHPGLYAGTLDQIKEDYGDILVKVYVRAGDYIVVDKGIRCARFRVLSDVLV